MFYRYFKLERTKDVRDIDNPRCIIISQSNIDFPIVDMLKSKGVKVVINCVDEIYENKYLEYIVINKIKLYYVNKAVFNHLKDRGNLFLNENGFIYEDRIFRFKTPRIIKRDKLLKGFIENTVDYMLREKSLVDQVKVHGIFKSPGENLLIISRGSYTQLDIMRAKRVIKELSPTIIAVDGGYDTAIRYGIKPDIVVGDLDSISLRGINKSPYIVLHSYLDGHCPGKVRLPSEYPRNKIGFIECFGTSEDAAILYAAHFNAKRIITLGYHNSSCDFIEKGRAGMASSILINLKYGDIIESIREADWSRAISPFLIIQGLILLISLGIYFSIYTGVFK